MSQPLEIRSAPQISKTSESRRSAAAVEMIGSQQRINIDVSEGKGQSAQIIQPGIAAMEQDKFCVRIPAYGFGQIPAVALLHLSQTGVNLQRGMSSPAQILQISRKDIVLEMEDILFCGIGRRKKAF